MPAPNFHPPSPEITRKDEGDWQWWHIPVSVKRWWPRRDIPCCEAFVDFIEGRLKGQEFRLRWRSDHPSGSSETALIFGGTRMIPLVARRDNSPKATLTDNDFLMIEAGTYSLAGVTGQTVILGVLHPPEKRTSIDLDPGVHRAKIRIVSGHLIWESTTYEIRVPPSGASNSHFTITMEN